MDVPEGSRVRAAVLEDYDRLRPVFVEVEAFHRHALPHVFREPADVFPPRDLYAALIGGPDSTILVAEKGRELIGFVTVRVAQARDDPLLVPRRFAVVDMLAVRSDRRRRGVGRALMDAVHDWAHDRGLREIELNVWEFNQHAIRFYQALGYQTVSRRMERQEQSL